MVIKGNRGLSLGRGEFCPKAGCALGFIVLMDSCLTLPSTFPKAFRILSSLAFRFEGYWTDDFFFLPTEGEHGVGVQPFAA